MDPNSRLLALGAGSGAEAEPVYVDDVFSTFLYDGNGIYSGFSGTNNIVNGIDLADKGGLVWGRARSNSTNYNHALFDTERGVSKVLNSDTNGAESTYAGRGVTAFNSDGFTLTSNLFGENQNGAKCVAWTFRKAPGFFDIVTWTGDGTGDRYINHNLGSVPGCVIVKKLNSSMDWGVYHRSLGSVQTAGLELNTTDPTGTSGNVNPIRTTPTSTQIYIRGGGSGTEYNDSGDTFVAYLFAHDDQSFGANQDESIIECGTYTGSSSTDQAIDIGWEPQWVMIKSSSTSGGPADWRIFDNMRGWRVRSLGDSASLTANTNNAEQNSHRIHINSRGWEFENEGANAVNGLGETYIYIAIRRPHKAPSAGTDVFAMDTSSGTSPTPPTFNAGFPVDMAFYKSKNSSTSDWELSTRMLEGYALNTNNTGSEAVDTDFTFDYSNGTGDSTFVASNVLSWLFKRAAGYFDVVCYTGTGASTPSQPHSLGVKPEFKIIKRRDGNGDWVAGGEVLGDRDNYVYLNSADGQVATSNYWDAVDTATTFSIRANNGNSGGNGMNYVAFLFATVAGVSKVGTYAGTGNTINVDCGFSSGARFVVIKRLDGNGSWRLFDTDQGINAGNDPYLLLNRSDAQTSADHIDPLSSGFTITSGAPAALNTNGGSYLFLAFA